MFWLRRLLPWLLSLAIALLIAWLFAGDGRGPSVIDLRLHLIAMLRALAGDLGLPSQFVPWFIYAAVVINILLPVWLIALWLHRRCWRHILAGQRPARAPWPQVGQRRYMSDQEQIIISGSPPSSWLGLRIILPPLFLALVLFLRDQWRISLDVEALMQRRASIAVEVLAVVLCARLCWAQARLWLIARFARCEGSQYLVGGWLCWRLDAPLNEAGWRWQARRLRPMEGVERPDLARTLARSLSETLAQSPRH
ncbi:MAG: hypothetical protein EA402_08645 [Planctomycetota bacterium]|nr:MAG: hypothetical protein EA402_08645 [Planctomycetota bacterium]